MKNIQVETMKLNIFCECKCVLFSMVTRNMKLKIKMNMKHDEKRNKYKKIPQFITKTVIGRYSSHRFNFFDLQ